MRVQFIFHIKFKLKPNISIIRNGVQLQLSGRVRRPVIVKYNLLRVGIDPYGDPDSAPPPTQ